MRLRLTAMAALSFAVLAMSGCSELTRPIAPVVEPTWQGNWVLNGVPPDQTAKAQGVAATLVETGSQLTASLLVSTGCGGNSGETWFAIKASGTVASDGSFTLTTGDPVPELPTATITGTLPASENADWTGTYSVTLPPAGACPEAETLSGAINATPFPTLDATYAGSAEVTGASTQTATLTFAVQQDVASTPGGADSDFNFSGALTLGGGGCLTSGTLVTGNGEEPAVASGNGVLGFYQMNDGSVMQLSATYLPASPYTMSINMSTTTPGSCGVSFIQAVGMQRQ